MNKKKEQKPKMQGMTLDKVDISSRYLIHISKFYIFPEFLLGLEFE